MNSAGAQAQWAKALGHKSVATKLQLKPHAVTNMQELKRQFKANTRLWDTAFAFLATHDLSKIEVGNYPLAGDSCMVKVSYSTPKEPQAASWEAHKKYIDIQYISVGSESIGLAPAAGAVVSKPYNEAKDVMNFDIQAAPYYEARSGTFFVFFPADAHRPGLRAADDMIRKVVVKILAAP
ncbi:hypothetical protein BUE76_09620 [Cnuella takakiae]|nr:hypothetical protein BUE76_09620 [Cnuella takakiae]